MLKKDTGRTLLLTASILALIMMISCASSDTKPVSVSKELKSAPKWVLNPFANGDNLAAVGTSMIGPGGLSFARTEAMAIARDEIARMVNVKVKNMVTSFSERSGIGDEQTNDNVVTSVSKQIASEVLSGTRQKEIWISKNNELFILVVMDSELARKIAKDMVLNTYRDNPALWQKIEAGNAIEDMDKAADMEFSR